MAPVGPQLALWACEAGASHRQAQLAGLFVVAAAGFDGGLSDLRFAAAGVASATKEASSNTAPTLSIPPAVLLTGSASPRSRHNCRYQQRSPTSGGLYGGRSNNSGLSRCPSGRFPANGARLACCVLVHSLACCVFVHSLACCVFVHSLACCVFVHSLACCVFVHSLACCVFVHSLACCVFVHSLACCVFVHSLACCVFVHSLACCVFVHGVACCVLVHGVACCVFVHGVARWTATAETSCTSPTATRQCSQSDPDAGSLEICTGILLYDAFLYRFRASWVERR